MVRPLTRDIAFTPDNKRMLVSSLPGNAAKAWAAAGGSKPGAANIRWRSLERGDRSRRVCAFDPDGSNRKSSRRHPQLRRLRSSGERHAWCSTMSAMSRRQPGAHYVTR